MTSKTETIIGITYDLRDTLADMKHGSLDSYESVIRRLIRDSKYLQTMKVWFEDKAEKVTELEAENVELKKRINELEQNNFT